ncbi:MAG: AAA family ATPase [Lachnospiraceae bacterium]|nr:AAA family ATPase [Lachnospiraceae bacterium]
MKPLELINADNLYYKPLPHPEMLIEGILCSGLAILSGDSKIGKSWLVLWLSIKIAKGEPVWGIPTKKTDVVYLALEDRDWRIQDRMQLLTDDPPANLHIGFCCGLIGQELECQIKKLLKEMPTVGIIFIDTLQKIRENVSAKLNAYAKDYQDLGALKQIADEHRICIFLVHHTRKERDGSNVFQNITGSTGIAGVADTLMVLQKENHFSDEAILSITGRDIEERVIHMKMDHNVWIVTEELDPKLLRKNEIPIAIYRIAEYFLSNYSFNGLMTDFVKELDVKDLQPNVVSRYLTKYYEAELKPLGLHYESHRSNKGRVINMWRESDDSDGYDATVGDENQSSPVAKETYQELYMTMMAGRDGQLSFPLRPSPSSLPSPGTEEVSSVGWIPIDDNDDDNPFSA